MNNKSTTVLTPNVGFTDRQIRIVSGSALLVALLLAAPTPMNWWTVPFLVAAAVIVSGIIGWDPLYAVLRINNYQELHGKIAQRSWSCPNLGSLDRAVRFAVGGALIAFTMTSPATLSVVGALIAIPIVTSAIIAWDPFYAASKINSFASKGDVETADADLSNGMLAECFTFPGERKNDRTPVERAA